LQPVLLGQPAGSSGSRRVFPSPIFSSTRPGFSPGSAESWVDPPGFKTMSKPNCFYKKTETGSNRFGSVFSVWLGFFLFGSIFFGLTRFFLVGFDLVF
jgi:hypothetical protein